MKISTILDQIDNGGVALLGFQRGYVSNRDQVRGLFAEKAANTAGYRFFTDVEAFKQHVRHEVLALEEPVPA